MRPIIMAAQPPQAAAAPAGPIFDPTPGSYSNTGARSASFSITASQPVEWDWSASGDLPTSTVASGGSSTSITFSLSTSSVGKSCAINVTVGGDTWTINLTVAGVA